jgi:outer membrane protein insertion porin family
LVIGQSIGQLPAFEQYFIGGSETVRGYDADEQFGDNQVYGNMELRYRFQNKFQFVAFMDAGSAYGGRFSSTDSFEALFGYGVGVRLQTPIGPVRLDLAKGSGGGGFKTHFGIGSSF